MIDGRTPLEAQKYNPFHNQDQIKRSITRELNDLQLTFQEAQGKLPDQVWQQKSQELAQLKKQADALLETEGIPNDAIDEIKAFRDQVAPVVDALYELNRQIPQLVKQLGNKS